MCFGREIYNYSLANLAVNIPNSVLVQVRNDCNEKFLPQKFDTKKKNVRSVRRTRIKDEDRTE